MGGDGANGGSEGEGGDAGGNGDGTAQPATAMPAWLHVARQSSLTAVSAGAPGLSWEVQLMWEASKPDH